MLLPVGASDPAVTPLCMSFLAAAAWDGVLGTGTMVTVPVADNSRPPILIGGTSKRLFTLSLIELGLPC
eukprot:3010474-Karenia_brevis.AAC.1